MNFLTAVWKFDQSAVSAVSIVLTSMLNGAFVNDIWAAVCVKWAAGCGGLIDIGTGM